MDQKTKKPKLQMYFNPNLRVQISPNASGFSYGIELDNAYVANGNADNRELAEELVSDALEALNLDKESLDRLTSVIHHHGQIAAIKGLRQASTFKVYVREIRETAP